jgi:hypothetical protein
MKTVARFCIGVAVEKSGSLINTSLFFRDQAKVVLFLIETWGEGV